MQSPDAKQQHKKRVSKACDCCRKSKTKCDGQRPCTRCLQDNKICTYMSNKKKADKLYPSSYVDLLETRVSILIQSLNKLLEKSRSEVGIEEFMKDPVIYNENGEFDINKVICQLLSSEKLQNLSQSNMNYSIDEITNVTDNRNSSTSSSTSPTSNTTTSSPSSTPLHISIPRKSQDLSHVHKPQHTKHQLKSPTTTFDFNNNLDSLLYEPMDLNNTSDDTHSTNSSLMSPVYSLNDQNGLYLDTWSQNQQQQQQQQTDFPQKSLNNNDDYGLIKQEYGFNWDGFDFSKKPLEQQATFGFPEF